MDLPQAAQEFEALLNYLKNNRGYDLTGYKRNTLVRRFGSRMQQLKINSYQEYIEYLQNNTEEWLTLLNTILINYTGFFRDPESWDYLAKEIIPQIIASKLPDEPIRVWSAGCATGEEVYSLVMLWAEALGIESCIKRVQFYATDIDEEALEQARQGTYRNIPAQHLSPNPAPKSEIVPEDDLIPEITSSYSDLLKKYFQPNQQGYTFEPRLRRTIIFAHHHLVEDAPISKSDLLVCRNVLIYFTPEYQATILVRFHFALKDAGFLFLGSAESIINNRPIFTSISLKHRIYAKGIALELNDYLLINSRSRTKRNKERLDLQGHFWRTAFESSPLAQIAVDLNAHLVEINESANLLFDLNQNDQNLLFEQLEPGKLVSLMKEFYNNPHQATLKNVEWNTATEIKHFDISITPVYNKTKTLLGAILTYIEIELTNSRICQLD